MLVIRRHNRLSLSKAAAQSGDTATQVQKAASDLVNLV